jgi:hypothetical protein
MGNGRTKVTNWSEVRTFVDGLANPTVIRVGF